MPELDFDCVIVDLHVTDEDQMCAYLDEACDHDVTITFVDSEDRDRPNQPLAVLLPYDRFVGLAASHRAIVDP